MTPPDRAPDERGATTPDPMHPNGVLLMKLGSALVHADELTSPKGHNLDRMALRAIVDDPDVRAWVAAMGVLLPRKRNAK